MTTVPLFHPLVKLKMATANAWGYGNLITIVVVNYNALFPELFRTMPERVRAAAYNRAGLIIGLIASLVDRHFNLTGQRSEAAFHRYRTQAFLSDLESSPWFYPGLALSDLIVQEAHTWVGNGPDAWGIEID